MEQTEIWLAAGSVSSLTRHLDDSRKKPRDSPSPCPSSCNPLGCQKH